MFISLLGGDLAVRGREERRKEPLAADSGGERKRWLVNVKLVLSAYV